MENKTENKIYFIYSQKKEESKPERIEANNNIEILKEETKNDYIYDIFCLKLQNKDNEMPFVVTLKDKFGELYFKNIDPKDTRKFIYEMNFESSETKGKNPSNQITLSYIEQFNIFENYFKNDYKILNDLFLNSINDLPKEKIKLFLFLFIKIYNLYLIKKDDLIKNTIIKYFEELNLNLLENEMNKIYNSNTPIKNNLNVDSNNLKFLSDLDSYKIRNELISITGNKEELNIKIDVLLSFYYINYKPKLFINFVDIKKEKFEEIKKHLVANKKIFNDFNSEIMITELLNETENMEQIHCLLNNFVPNMVELFKIFSNTSIYIKLIYLCQIEKRIIPILCKPQKSDDMDQLIYYFDKIMSLFQTEQILPIYINKDFFIEYCNIFLNEDYEKIEKVHLILKDYNFMVSEKFKIKIDDEINKYYHNTGIHLLTNKKLINREMIEFLQNDPYFESGKNPVPIDIIAEGIIFDETKSNKIFINSLFNNTFEDFDLKKFVGPLYNDFMQKIFAKFKQKKDLFNLRYLDFNYDIDVEVIKNLINTIRRLWLEDSKKYVYGLEQLIAKTFGLASIILDNYQSYINDIENAIENNIILPIYTELLSKKYFLSDGFKEHVIKYIRNNCGKSPINIWYFLNTIEDENERNEYLEKNLKPEYAVKAEYFIDYPDFIDEKITLFAELYNSKYFTKNENLTKLQYYKDSIDSKDNIYNLKYTETMKIYKNIIFFNKIFVFFIPGPYKEENILISDLILINFSEKCEKAKKFYDSLNIIHNYWEKFFKNEKNKEINDLKNLISKYETTPLKDCEKIENESNSYLSSLSKAEKGTKLIESIFFMSIYESYKDEYKNKDKERFEISLNKFNELEKLGINFDINLLEKDLKDILVVSAYNNKDKLENELDFIKTFFGFDSEKNNFNIIKIKESLLKLLNEYKKENNL